jgi:hypothetical protein
VLCLCWGVKGGACKSHAFCTSKNAGSVMGGEGFWADCLLPLLGKGKGKIGATWETGIFF